MISMIFQVLGVKVGSKIRSLGRQRRGGVFGHLGCILGSLEFKAFLGASMGHLGRLSRNVLVSLGKALGSLGRQACRMVGAERLRRGTPWFRPI